VELDDLLLFLPEQQARDAMDAFDGDADGHISADVAPLPYSHFSPELNCVRPGQHTTLHHSYNSRDTLDADCKAML